MSFKQSILQTRVYEATELAEGDVVRINVWQGNSATVSFEAAVPPEVAGTLEKAGNSLMIEDIVKINCYLTYNGEYSSEYLSENGGILVWTAEHSEYIPGTEEYSVAGVTKNGSYYTVNTEGIPAKQWGDDLYIMPYLVTKDGSIAYGTVYSYSPLTYAEKNVYKDTNKESLRNMLVAMINYGYAAQVNFNYKTEVPMNSILTSEDQAWTWDDSYLSVADTVDASKIGFVENSNLTSPGKSLLIEGAVGLNIYNTFNTSLLANATEYGMLYWSESTYNANTVIDINNAEKATVNKSGNYYIGVIAGTPAKLLGDTYYFCAYTIDADGNVNYGVVSSYNAHTYASKQIEKDADANLIDLCKTLVIYSNAAKAHFG